MSTKRIIDLQTASTLGSDDYVMIDSATSGTKKYAISELKTAIDGVEDGTGISDGAIGTDALDDGAVTNAKLASNSVGTSNLQNGAVTLAKIASGSEATTSASGLMSSTDKAKLDAFGAASTYALKTEIAGAYIYRGSVANEAALPVTGQKVGDVYNIIAASSYGQAGANVAWNGSAWDALGETFDIGNGTVTTSKIADLNVTEGKLANSAVTTNKIADANVTTAKIADSNVTTGKLANLGVTTGKIANNAVTSDKIASNAVITEKITDGAVTANKLDASAVTTAKINNLAVTTDKLASESVTSAKLASNSVSNAKIVDQAVSEGKLAPGSVTTPKIADLNVTEGKLANAAVTTDKVADGAITRDKLNEEVMDELDFKADVDGYYTDMTVGAADNLTGRGDTTTAEFLYRTAGGTADIETGQAVAKSIKGNTLVWNQISDNSRATVTTNGITFTNNGDGSITVSGTATAAATLNSVEHAEVTPQQGHVYLLKGCPAGGGSSTYRLQNPFMSGSQHTDFGSGRIYTDASTGTRILAQIYITQGATIENLVFRPQLFDLTQMFGAGNEPSTVAEFEALFPEPYYEYDAGSLLPVRMTGVETTGFNQWDEVAEDGYISDTTGDNVGNNTAYLRSKDYIPVFPGMAYHFTCTTGNNGGKVYYYDADKAFLSFEGVNCNGTDKTTPANARYMRFWLNYPGSYNNDICINLSWSGRRNGEYEAFWKSQRLIDVATYFPNGMRSAGTVRDELTSTEAITRVGVVDLNDKTGVTFTSTEEPNSAGLYNHKFTYTAGAWNAIGFDKFALNTANGYVPPSNIETPLGATNYPVQFASATKVGLGIYVATRVVYLRWPSLLTESQAFALVSGENAMLFAALATPIVTPIDPPLNLSYRVDDFGTERIMIPEDKRSAPPVLDIAYGLNVVDFVRRAPSEYMSHASFQQFCIALQTKLGIVITETWDDTDNRYEYSIADAPSSNEG